MGGTSRRTEEVSFLHKMYFIFSFVAIPIGLGGIAGGVVWIVMKPGAIVAACGSVIIFLGFCCATIPIGTSLGILNLRLRCQGCCLVITKSYIDLTKPQPRSFRSFDNGNIDNAAGMVVTNPYMEKKTQPNLSKLLRNYHEVAETDPQDVATSGEETDKVEEHDPVPRHELRDRGSSSQTQHKRRAPPAPQTVAELHNNITELKQSPRLGKPVPIPIVPMGYYNRAFEESAVKPQVNDSAKIDGFQMTVSIETVRQDISRDASVYTEIQKSPQNSASPRRNNLVQNEIVLPPRNISSLYPPTSPSNPTKYEEIGTRM